MLGGGNVCAGTWCGGNFKHSNSKHMYICITVYILRMLNFGRICLSYLIQRKRINSNCKMEKFSFKE